MTLAAYIADPANRFATVAMTDTNGLLRGQMVSTRSLKGIASAGTVSYTHLDVYKRQVLWLVDRHILCHALS